MTTGKRTRILAWGLGLLGVVVAAGAVYGYTTWRSVEREDFDPAAAREALAAVRASTTTSTVPPPAATPTTAPATTSPAPAAAAAAGEPPVRGPTGVDAYLLAGSDGGPSLGRADVVFLAVDPPDAAPVLVSVPRSLAVTSPCTGAPVRLALLLRGCGGVAGPSVVAVALEDLTGLRVGHFAVVGYDGFVRIVDALGGVEVCSDTARGIDGTVIVPAGCTLVDGEAARFWVASRFHDELVDGQWRAVAGDGDAARRRRQMDMLGKLVDRLGSVGSVGQLVGIAGGLTDTFVLDSGLGLPDAAALAWEVRGSGLRTVSLPVTSRLVDGVYIQELTEPFATTLSRLYPPAAGW